MELFTPLARTSLDLYGVKPGDFVAGFTGAHGMANGLDAVLDAAAELIPASHEIWTLGRASRLDEPVCVPRLSACPACLRAPHRQAQAGSSRGFALPGTVHCSRAIGMNRSH